MAAHGALQSAQRAQDPGALQSALAAAAPFCAALPALREDVELAQATLESLELGPPEGGGRGAAAPEPPPPERVTAVELALDELAAATEDFADARRIGSGGFGDVYAAEPMASLSPALRPVALRELKPAVKRAKAEAVSPGELMKEVAILKSAHHDHLLPLFGYCLDAAAPCLIFPLMVGGSLRARLDLGRRRPREPVPDGPLHGRGAAVGAHVAAEAACGGAGGGGARVPALLQAADPPP